MATTPDNWKAKLKELGFEFGPVWRHGYLDFDTGTSLVVSAGFGSWTYAKTRKRKDIFPVMYYDDQDRERYPDGHDLSRTKTGRAILTWVASEFCEPMGLLDCVPVKYKIITADAAQTLLHFNDARIRQWMNLNLWRVA